LRQLGVAREQVAAVMELTPNYVATLRQRSLREGTAGLVRPAGRPRETGEASWDQARAWRAAGTRDAEIARRVGGKPATGLRRLGRAQGQGAPPLAAEPAAAEPGPGELRAGEPRVTEPEQAAGTGLAGPDPARQPVTFSSRYAGAM